MAAPITDYMVVTGTSLARMEEGVKMGIDSGWEPLGGLCFAPHVSSTVNDPSPKFMQAMVKRQGDA